MISLKDKFDTIEAEELSSGASMPPKIPALRGITRNLNFNWGDIYCVLSYKLKIVRIKKDFVGYSCQLLSVKIDPKVTAKRAISFQPNIPYSYFYTHMIPTSVLSGLAEDSAGFANRMSAFKNTEETERMIYVTKEDFNNPKEFTLEHTKFFEHVLALIEKYIMPPGKTPLCISQKCEELRERFYKAYGQLILDFVREHQLSNEDFRKAFRRNNFQYIDTNINSELFGGRPWDYIMAGNTQGALDPPSAHSVVVTFGVEPYPFEVLAKSKDLSENPSNWSRETKLLAVALIDNQFYVCPLDVSYRVDESQLELAVMLAFSSMLASKETVQQN